MSKLIDLTGQKFGRLTVLSKDNNRITKGGSYWICQCKCGKIKSIKSSSLRRGEIQSCGCLRNERTKKAKENLGLVDNLIGQRFGLLTVIGKSSKRGASGAVYWICKCDCGNIKEIQGNNLKRKDENRTISCGCAHKSFGELKISETLNENNILYRFQYNFPDFAKYHHYDFALLSNNRPVRLIEFDGELHYKDIPHFGSLEDRQKRDLLKNQYAKDHNIPLVRIPYWERDNITLDMILGDKYLIK